MPGAEEGRQYAVDHVLLAHDPLGDLCTEIPDGRREPGQLLNVFFV
jgi:hypothetical protein